MRQFIAGVLVDSEKWEHDEEYRKELMNQYKNNPAFKDEVNTVYIESIGSLCTYLFFDRYGRFTAVTNNKKG